MDGTRAGLRPHPIAALSVSPLQNSRLPVFNRETAEREPRTSLQVVVAGGQPIFCDGLRALLRNTPDFQVTGEVADGELAIRLTREQSPDILLLDHPFPRQCELDVLREISALAPAVRTLMLAASLHEVDVLLALQLGARGVLLKSSANTQLLYEAIRCVIDGYYWIGNERIASLEEAVRAISLKGQNMSQRAFGLTSREIEIVSIVARGCSNAEIADALMLSVQTVKSHLKNIFDKLGVYSRLELTVFAINHQLLPNRR